MWCMYCMGACATAATTIVCTENAKRCTAARETARRHGQVPRMRGLGMNKCHSAHPVSLTNSQPVQVVANMREACVSLART